MDPVKDVLVDQGLSREQRAHATHCTGYVIRTFRLDIEIGRTRRRAPSAPSSGPACFGHISLRNQAASHGNESKRALDSIGQCMTSNRWVATKRDLSSQALLSMASTPRVRGSRTIEVACHYTGRASRPQHTWAHSTVLAVRCKNDPYHSSLRTREGKAQRSSHRH